MADKFINHKLNYQSQAEMKILRFLKDIHYIFCVILSNTLPSAKVIESYIFNPPSD